jgi:hypothetical protein
MIFFEHLFFLKRTQYKSKSHFFGKKWLSIQVVFVLEKIVWGKAL